ncbi:hypothetical protein [Streptomyces sp. NPDC059411]|uniref:hypothetical protein n=1 Tax=Streptomyces sp. NPDC059411 TaxID=3346825 RepID=UPI0036B2AD95
MALPDLFIEITDEGVTYWTLNRGLIEQLRHGTVPNCRDEDVAYELVTLLETELGHSDVGKRLSDRDVADVFRCSNAVLHRLGIERQIPFHTRQDYEQNHSYQGSITEIGSGILKEVADLERDYGRAGFRGVKGDLRNLIFASPDKPDLRWSNLHTNTVSIAKDAENFLVWDEAISPNGLTVSDVLTWWGKCDGITHLSADEQLMRLKDRFLKSCAPKSNQERYLLNAYWKFAEDRGFSITPALLPQVWLHYDPVTLKERGLAGELALDAQRRDFMMLAPGGRRVVLEVDGMHHYSKGGQPSREEYAKNVKGDRELRLQGYEVYRFGTYEFESSQNPAAMLAQFFTRFLAE